MYVLCVVLVLMHVLYALCGKNIHKSVCSLLYAFASKGFMVTCATPHLGE